MYQKIYGEFVFIRHNCNEYVVYRVLDETVFVSWNRVSETYTGT